MHLGPENPNSNKNASNPVCMHCSISVKRPLYYRSHLLCIEKRTECFSLFRWCVCPAPSQKYPNAHLLSAIVEAWPGRLGWGKGPSPSRDRPSHGTIGSETVLSRTQGPLGGLYISFRAQPHRKVFLSETLVFWVLPTAPLWVLLWSCLRRR